MRNSLVQHLHTALVIVLIIPVCIIHCGVNRNPSFNQSLTTYSQDYLLSPGASNNGNFAGGLPPPSPVVSPSWNIDIIEDFEDLLERESDDDVETFDIEYIEADEGGELEVGESEIEIPEYALPQDTLMIFYIPNSEFIEYWVYPGSLTFNDSVEIELSYQSAYLEGIDETNISIAQWLPQFQMWEDLGGVVDTLNNIVSLKVLEFAFPEEDTTYARYALADHN
ncbi:MAG: hypothetical protein ACE5OP_11840 [Candidatus Glassbacteria bacterium]